MKQLQSQMEAEMRMKTELVRHQMQILSEVQSDSDFNEVISRLAGKTSHWGKSYIFHTDSKVNFCPKILRHDETHRL